MANLVLQFAGAVGLIALVPLLRIIIELQTQRYTGEQEGLCHILAMNGLGN